MNNSITRKIFLLFLVAPLVLGVYFLSRFYLGGNLILDLSNVDMDNSAVIVNGETQKLYGYNEQTKRMTIPDFFGSKDIKIHSAGHEVFSEKTTMYTRGTKNINVNIREIDPVETAKEIAESTWSDQSIEVTESKYAYRNREDRTREKIIEFTVKVKGITTSVSAHYDAIGNAWKLDEFDS